MKRQNNSMLAVCRMHTSEQEYKETHHGKHLDHGFLV